MRQDIAELPELLDHVDGLIADGTIGGRGAERGRLPDPRERERAARVRRPRASGPRPAVRGGGAPHLSGLAADAGGLPVAHRDRLVQRGIRRHGGHQAIATALALERIRPDVAWAERIRRVGLVDDPRALLELAVELSRAPAGVARVDAQPDAASRSPRPGRASRASPPPACPPPPGARTRRAPPPTAARRARRGTRDRPRPAARRARARRRPRASRSCGRGRRPSPRPRVCSSTSTTVRRK